MKRKFFIKNLIVFLIPLLIPTLILGTFSMLISQRYIRDNVEKNNMNILTQSRENIELILNEADSLSLSFGSDPVITKRVKGILTENTYSIEELDSIDFIKSNVGVPVNTKPYIHSVYVYFNNENQRFISSSDGLSDLGTAADKSWYDSYVKLSSSEDLWSESREIKLYNFEKNPTPVVSIYKTLYSPGSTISSGVIVLNVYKAYVENILKKLATVENQSIIVTDKSNNILFKNREYPYLQKLDIQKLVNNPQQSFVINIDNYLYSVSSIHSSQYGWNYISIAPQKSLYKLPYSLKDATILLLMLSILIGLILAYYFTRKNYSQIERILFVLNSAENGDVLPPLPSRVKDEYGFIIQNILKTFIEQSYLKVQLSEKKYKMQALELIALQSQINPHFLYNTLHTIYWEVLNLSGKPGVANQMITNLTDILEYSLSNPNETVSLEEEIKNTRSYIDIQKVRYKDKFDFIWEYDEEVINHRVIKLLLQPLIENSLYHGIKEKEGKGSIKVKILNFKTYLRISVIDSGIGIRKENLAEIREGLKRETDHTDHIGVYNTNKRIILFYGEEYGIRILSKYGAGTVIQMKIPLGASDHEELPVIDISGNEG